MLSTFLVSNTDDSGPGSLRQAIIDANDSANVGGFRMRSTSTSRDPACTSSVP